MRVQLMITGICWFGSGNGLAQLTGYYLNQWWPSTPMHKFLSRPEWVKRLTWIYNTSLFYMTLSKPLHEPMLPYSQLDPHQQISVKFQTKLKYFYSRKCMWKFCLQNRHHFVQALMWLRKVNRNPQWLPPQKPINPIHKVPRLWQKILLF